MAAAFARAARGQALLLLLFFFQGPIGDASRLLMRIPILDVFTRSFGLFHRRCVVRFLFAALPGLFCHGLCSSWLVVARAVPGVESLWYD